MHTRLHPGVPKVVTRAWEDSSPRATTKTIVCPPGAGRGRRLVCSRPPGNPAPSAAPPPPPGPLGHEPACRCSHQAGSESRAREVTRGAQARQGHSTTELTPALGSSRPVFSRDLRRFPAAPGGKLPFRAFQHPTSPQQRPAGPRGPMQPLFQPLPAHLPRQGPFVAASPAAPLAQHRKPPLASHSSRRRTARPRAEAAVNRPAAAV